MTIPKDEYVFSRSNASSILNKQRIQQTHLTFRCDNAINKQNDTHRTDEVFDSFGDVLLGKVIIVSRTNVVDSSSAVDVKLNVDLVSLADIDGISSLNGV